MSQGQTECEFELSPAESTPEEIAGPVETKKDEPESGTGNSTVQSAAPKTTLEAARPPNPIEKDPEPKLTEKPTTVVKNETSTKEAAASNQTEMDAGLERASRIAKRKQGFWEKHFKKT